MTAYKRDDVVPVGFVFSAESGKKLRPAVAINSSAYYHTVTRGVIYRKLGVMAKVDIDAVDNEFRRSLAL